MKELSQRSHLRVNLCYIYVETKIPEVMKLFWIIGMKFLNM